MKQLLYTLAAFLFTSSALAQITLNSSPTVSLNVLDSATLPLSMASLPSMAPANGGSWDLDSITLGAAIHTATYRAPTPGFSIANFADSVNYSIATSAGIGYKAFRNFQQSSSGVVIPGEEILARQAFGLGSLTANALDSISFPLQAINYSTPLPVMKFPATLGSSWSATTNRNLNLNITVSSYSLNNAPAQHRQVRRYLDSVVGWGSMTVPVPGKSGSAWIQVLQVQHTEIVLDSFFITAAGGPMTPAPAPLLAVLGLTQGQTTTRLSTYFYRAGAFRPLAAAVHSGSTFSSAPSGFSMHAKNLPALAVHAVSGIGEVRIYPNPVRNGSLHIDLPGAVSEGWSYTLINISGQQVAKSSIAVGATTRIATITFPESLPSGIYYIMLANANKQMCVVPVTIE